VLVCSSEDETDLSGQSKTTESVWVFIFIILLRIAENIAFKPTIYFQPSIDDFENDYKASMILSLRF